jgi:DNA polymerase-1
MAKIKEIYPEADEGTGWTEEYDCLACKDLVRDSAGSLNCCRGRFYGKDGELSWKGSKVDILFLGEAPGVDDAKFGEFFAGASGRRLMEWIKICGLEKKSIYLDSAIRCTLIDKMSEVSTVNKKKLIKNCSHWLHKELKRLKPKVIVPLGNIGLQALTGITGITKWHGRVMRHHGLQCYIIPAFHPGAVRGDRPDLAEFSLNAIDTAKAHIRKKKGFKLPEWELVESETQFSEMMSYLKSRGKIVVDLETHGLDSWAGDTIENIIGICLSSGENYGYYVPIMAYSMGSGEWLLGSPKDKKIKRWLRELKKLLENKRKLKIMHNAAYDLLWLKQLGWDVYPVYDTMIVNSVIDDVDNGLKDLAWIYTDFGGYDSALGTYLKNSKASYVNVPVEILGMYGAYDAVATDIVYEAQLEQFSDNKTLKGLVKELNDLRYYLTDMEHKGCLIDFEWLEKSKKLYIEKIQTHVNNVRKVTKNPELNLNSSVQMLKVFWGDQDSSGLFNKNNFKFKKLSTDKHIVKTLLSYYKKFKGKPSKAVKDRIMVLESFQNYRRDTKRLSTYLEAWNKNHINGRVHPYFKVYNTITGRLSSNLQQTPRGDEIRGCIVAPEGYTLVEFDYSQLELRVAAQYSRDDAICDPLNAGVDAHALIGNSSIKRADGKDYGETRFKDGELRVKAKGISFSILYGKTLDGLAEMLGTDLEGAARVQGLFFRQFPGLKRWVDTQQAYALSKGYIVTLFGRRLSFNGYNMNDKRDRSAVMRRAVNWPVQSAASDCVVHGLNRVERYIRKKKWDAESNLQIHDSIMYEVKDDLVDEFIPTVKKLLEQRIPVMDKVILYADCKYGKRWGSLKRV